MSVVVGRRFKLTQTGCTMLPWKRADATGGIPTLPFTCRLPPLPSSLDQRSHATLLKVNVHVFPTFSSSISQRAILLPQHPRRLRCQIRMVASTPRVHHTTLPRGQRRSSWLARVRPQDSDVGECAPLLRGSQEYSVRIWRGCRMPGVFPGLFAGERPPCRTLPGLDGGDAFPGSMDGEDRLFRILEGWGGSRRCG